MLTPLLMAAGIVAAWQQDKLTIVATTDVHGRAMHWDYLHDREAPWGLTRAATAIDSIRQANGGAVVLVDAGDLFQGNLFARYFATQQPIHRHPIVDALNFMRYDVFTPGNHDFDFGVDMLDSTLAYALFNVVSANIFGGGRPAYRQHVVIERNGLRVGVTGGTTQGTQVWNRDKLAGRREVRSVLADVSIALQRMEEDGVDLKLVVLHSGLGGSSSDDARDTGAENVAAQVAYLPVKPDIVVVGHTHRSLRDSVINGVHFIQPEPWARGLAVADISFARDESGSAAPRVIVARGLSLENVPPQRELVARLDAAHRMARSWGDTPLARSPAEWSGQFSRVEDTPVIDFINHVQLQQSGAQLSATASFNPDAGFPSGIVRMRHVMGIYPFENTLDVVAIDGATLKRYLERIAEYFGNYVPGRPPTNPSIPGYNFDMIGGLDYVIDVRMPVGSRIRQMVYEGRLVQPTDRFTLALNNYRRVAAGFEMLSGLEVVRRSNERVADLLVDEVRRVGTLVPDAYFQPSWSVIPREAQDAMRIAAGAPDPAIHERHVVRIVATTDLRGSVEPRETSWSSGRAVGGLPALAGWIDSLSADCACPTVLVDAGGALGGSLIADRMFGRLVVDAMNMMRYDAAVVGERELAWGLDTLRARAAQARFPWLAANTRSLAEGARPDWARDWVMVERGGARVGIIGVTAGPATAIPLVEADRFAIEDPAATVRRLIPEVRGAGADYVVLVAHHDAYCDPAGCRGELVDIVNALESGSIDLVIGGHSSSEAVTTINGVPVLLPGSDGLSFGVADIRATSRSSRVLSSVQTVWVDSVGVDIDVASLVRASAFDANAVVTRMGFPASGGTSDSPLGRLVADAYRNAARSHIAIVANTTISGQLPAGDITYADVYAVLPVRHQIRRMRVRGDLIEDLLEQVVRGEQPMAHVAGLSFEYDPRARPGDRVRRIRLDGDRGLDRSATYWLAVNDVMTSATSAFPMLAGVMAEPVGMSDFEAFTRYLSRLPKPVETPRTERIRARR